MDPKQYKKMPLLTPQEEIDFLATFKAYKKGGCEGPEPKIKTGFRLSKQGNHDFFKLALLLPGDDPDRPRMTNAQALRLDAKRRREKVAEERLIIRRAVDNFISDMPSRYSPNEYRPDEHANPDNDRLNLIDVRLMFESIPGMRKMDSRMAEIQNAMRGRMLELNCLKIKGKWYTTPHTSRPEKLPDYIPAEELY